MSGRKPRKSLSPREIKRMGLPRQFWRPPVPVEDLWEGANAQLYGFYRDPVRWIEKGVSLGLWGPPGCGKSTLVASIARRSRLLYQSVYWTSGWKWREDRRAGRQFSESFTVTDHCLDVDLLVIDDYTAMDWVDRYYGI